MPWITRLLDPRVHLINACCLHSCLKYISGDFITNTSLRERFGIVENNYFIVSGIISNDMKSSLNKDPDRKSAKRAKHVPFWA